MRRKPDPKTTDTIDYIATRLEWLYEEREKSKGSEMIFDKAITELDTVLELLKRNKLLSMNPMGG